mgnify:CR=1 FL=1
MGRLTREGVKYLGRVEPATELAEGEGDELGEERRGLEMEVLC